VKGVKRALRYVAGHAEGRELVLGGCEPVKLVGYSDASYEPGHDSRFRYGFNLALGVHSGSYTVISKRSKTVSHSSLQSEMRALCDAAKEISADRDLLTLLGCPQNGPTLLHTDSLCVPSIWLTTNSGITPSAATSIETPTMSVNVCWLGFWN